MASGVTETWHFFPTGDIRNDLYLTLERGDFERGGKSVQKNIEVTMYVLYADGEILKVRLASQFGTEADPEMTSCSVDIVPDSPRQDWARIALCVLLHLFLRQGALGALLTAPSLWPSSGVCSSPDLLPLVCPRCCFCHPTWHGAAYFP